MKLFSYKNRPVHLGPFPAEHLKRTNRIDTTAPAGPRPPRRNGAAAPSGIGAAALEYLRFFEGFRDGDVAPAQAPVPDDPQALANELKSAAYFMDASQVGVCRIPENAWYDGQQDLGHDTAFVILVEHGQPVEVGSRAAAWIGDGADDCAATRAAELAVVLAGYVRRMGFPARAHTRDDSDVDQATLAVAAGLAQRDGTATVSPYLGTDYAAAVVTTTMPLAPDQPLAPQALRDRSFGYMVGRDGTRSRLRDWQQRRRASHLGPYPMERIKRVEDTTTLILEDEVPRVPKRAAFFERALRGDMGAKAQRERARFATKHPFAHAMTPLIRGMVPFQDGQIAPQRAVGHDDAEDNTRAIKSLGYFLGADMVGICEAKPYTWYSHKEDGTPIEPRHRYAIVMLFDQGHETMEGASGDDWISGAQSMRSYLRGAEVCGLAASHIRSLGYSARSQTNADSDVLHIPLVLLAGLGELSRIGELVLNPYVGPRFKSAVVTTDLPLVPDKPIDFGLQDMCNKCLKCARECPCDAIPYGDKVMFNGYEMWKPDVQRCTSYRVTNPHGSACGRCMKMCPYNHEGLLYHRLFLWMAIHLPFTRKWIADLDDTVRHGAINPIKKWWHDIEWLPDGTTATPKGVNRRDLDIAKGDSLKDKQKMAYYHANMMPPPDHIDPVKVDRKAAMAAAALLETPDEARQRRRQGGSRPAHYVPTPPQHTASE